MLAVVQASSPCKPEGDQTQEEGRKNTTTKPIENINRAASFPSEAGTAKANKPTARSRAKKMTSVKVPGF
jgi:hypothetical protein